MTHGHLKNSMPPLAGKGRHKNSDHLQYTTNHQRPIDRVLDAIQARGGRVNRSGGQWMCTCPAHDDRNPSLSVKQGDDRRVLLHCHRGCSVESVVDVLGLEMRDLFVPDTCDSDSFRPQRLASPQSVAVAHDTRVAARSAGYSKEQEAVEVCARSMGGFDLRWEYHDASGNLVGIVLRRNLPGGKKTCRPISLIDGRWHLKGMPVPRPLYRLPELLASDAPVIICEGEKATDAAIACGYTATTSPHGSNSAKQADWSVLRDRDVIIIPDLNEAGDAYAREVLFFSESAKSVRVVDLSLTWPQLGEGDDLADVLSIEGGDPKAVRAKLNALIEQTPIELQNSTITAQTYRPFPVELLPEPVRSFVMQGSEALGCDASYIALPMLVMLAGSVGNSRRIRLKSTWSEPCILWSCVVGRSGTNKSAAIDLAIQPLQEIQNRCIREYQAQLSGWSPESDDPRPIMPRMIIDDATIESVLQLLEQNPRGLILRRDELNGWFNFDKYSSGKGSTNSARWIELFHARPVSVDRATKGPIFVHRASLSIIGGIQPGILRSVLDRSNIESGLAGRFLFVMPQHIPKQWSSAQLDPALIASVSSIVESLICLSLNTSTPDASDDDPQPHIIDLLPEAIELFERFYNEHNRAMEQEEERIAAAWAKLECYVARFALLIHLIREAAGDPTLEDPERVDAISMQAAIELVEWFKHETKRVYAMLAMDEGSIEDHRVIEWIDKQGGAVTVREFSRGLARYNDAKRAEQKLRDLEQSGIGQFQGRKPNGRTQEFVLHAEHRSPSATTVTASSCPQAPTNLRNDSGASGRYPVLSSRKGQ